ncbi:uncharacterized protein PHACADRAFT_263833 [Phanerochaete carnosa HHB-10118-sp]|uniref:Uncharacterized protein n=1 Tax=Phanerochaete carnosa (strain HHB-10118-sp) TaxID=650164 RepID=K5VVA6_PHACS|nr:uncharacterized protein PHACADRAFT_263833 [Phanerochaete carnosa HHB-10118-sp]EKM50504.1 hypothetical protein PHACADRAFT_263833 [Phanerochaete carnosa HHB-10118-sp]
MSAANSVEASPLQSPISGSPTLSRRLSARRGSVSAADPWGQHADVNFKPTRSSSSRLTIVRVPQQDQESGGRRHRRDGSNTSISSTSSEGKAGRLSFAFSSFTPIKAGEGGGRSSPTGSPKLRPSSPGGIGGPGLVRRPSAGSSALPQYTKLSPEQLVELAHNSTHPKPSGPLAGSTSVNFTPLPDDVYLPFIDRPSEVTSLISTSPTAKLFALLSQTFPPDARAPASAVPNAKTPSVDSDPRLWSYAELENWLKKIPREEIDDATWVHRARQCIRPRSELIWERAKGALGIPPELDTDELLEEEIDPLAAYIPSARAPIAIPQGIPRLGLNSQMLDADVFEPDSPVVTGSVSGSQTFPPPSPVDSDTELSIEPVLPAAPPPPSTVDPTTGATMTSLHELREEDEEAAEQEGAGAGDAAKFPASLPSDVQGLRISCSAQPSVSPILLPHGFSSSSVGSLGRGASISPSPRRLSAASDKDSVYDALAERGPGHPLFPSSFAHLSNVPTLRSSRSSSRSNSMSFVPPLVGGLRRESTGAQMAGRRPDWARAYDPNKHDEAVTVSSVNLNE